MEGYCDRSKHAFARSSEFSCSASEVRLSVSCPMTVRATGEVSANPFSRPLPSDVITSGSPIIRPTLRADCPVQALIYALRLDYRQPPSHGASATRRNRSEAFVSRTVGPGGDSNSKTKYMSFSLQYQGFGSEPIFTMSSGAF